MSVIIDFIINFQFANLNLIFQKFMFIKSNLKNFIIQFIKFYFNYQKLMFIKFNVYFIIQFANLNLIFQKSMFITLNFDLNCQFIGFNLFLKINFVNQFN